MTQEEIRIKELRKEISFLEEKVAELSKARSGLENEIIKAHKDYKAKLDSEFTSKSARLDVEYEQKTAKQAEQQKYLDDYLVRLDKQNMEQKAREDSIATKEKLFASDVEVFNKNREAAIKEIEDRRKAIDQDKLTIQTADNGLRIQAMAQANERINLDTKILNIESAQLKLDEQKKQLDKDIATNYEIMAAISHEKDLVIEEKTAINVILDQIHVEKKSIIELAAYKDDLEKFEAEKSELETTKEELKKRTKSLIALEASMSEREKAAVEKEKYLMIKERELKADLDKKIEILNKLRQGAPVA